MTKKSRQPQVLMRPNPGESDDAFVERFAKAMGDAAVKAENERRKKAGKPPLPKKSTPATPDVK
jgi:hypothetical protein